MLVFCVFLSAIKPVHKLMIFVVICDYSHPCLCCSCLVVAVI